MSRLGQCYVLKLKGGKWYVGWTEKGYKRIQAHEKKRGAAWTEKHPPVKPIPYEQTPPRKNKATRKNKPNSDEDKLTLKLMEKHGIRNVRGGSWCMVKMRKKTFREIEGLIEKSKDNSCSRCGRSSHSTSKCFAGTHANGNKIGNPNRVIDRGTYRSLLKERKELRRAQLEAEESKKESEERAREIGRLKEEIRNLEKASEESDPGIMMKIIQSISEENVTLLAKYAVAGLAVASLASSTPTKRALRSAMKQIEDVSDFVKKMLR